MTLSGVEFHFNVPDRLNYACRLLRKAVATGARVHVLAPPDLLTHLDRLLWTFAPSAFVPHAWFHAGADVLEFTPVVLWPEGSEVEPQHALHAPQVLVNLSSGVPLRYDHFSRFIELVDADEAVRKSARLRWRAYEAAGYACLRHDYTVVAAQPG